ncbi:MAG: ExbD/TolR family protein [Polyangiaceae bacterium]|jgi:biopolymer transport protein ExbD
MAEAEQPPTEFKVPPPVKPASMATYKRLLRKEIKRRAGEAEINFLNITAMLDMMTIILVFLLKSMAASTAAIPQSADLTVPASILQSEASQEGLIVLVSKTSITVDENTVCPVPPDASHGVEARYKKGGATDLVITPLLNSTHEWRERDRNVRLAQGKDPNASEAIIVADKGTPYRLLCEVLFTLGQTEFSKFHLMVMQGKKP